MACAKGERGSGGGRLQEGRRRICAVCVLQAEEGGRRGRLRTDRERGHSPRLLRVLLCSHIPLHSVLGGPRHLIGWVMMFKRWGEIVHTSPFPSRSGLRAASVCGFVSRAESTITTIVHILLVLDKLGGVGVHQSDPPTERHTVRDGTLGRTCHALDGIGDLLVLRGASRLASVSRCTASRAGCDHDSGIPP